MCLGPSDPKLSKVSSSYYNLKNTHISQKYKERQHMNEEHCKEKNLEIVMAYKTKDTAFYGTEDSNCWHKVNPQSGPKLPKKTVKKTTLIIIRSCS